MLTFGEGGCLEIFGAHTSAPVPIGVIDVVVANEGRVLAWLVGGEVSDKPTIAESDGVAVDYERAVVVTWKHRQLAASAFGVDVTGDWSASGYTRATTRCPKDVRRRANMGIASGLGVTNRRWQQSVG
jgi:hypothetical protein